MWLGKWEPLSLSSECAKFDHHRSCGSEDVYWFLVTRPHGPHNERKRDLVNGSLYVTRFLLCDVKWPHDLRNMWLFKWEPLALRLMLWSWRLYVLWDWRCSTFILSRSITWLHDQKFMWLGKLPMSQVWYLQVLWKWRYSAFFVMRHHKITWSKGHVTW